MTPVEATNHRTVALALMPAVFVFLWSTGFIGAKLGLPYVEPMTFLGLRFAICTLLLVPVVLLTRTRWPDRLADWGHIGFAGLLMHGGYLGFVFMGIGLGVPAGTAALIAGIQPLLVAALAGLFLGERVTGRQWLGLLLGLGGVILVVADKLSLGEGSVLGIGLCFAALFSIAFGTLYQKKYCSGMSLKSGNLIQFFVATVYFGLVAWAFEDMSVNWSGELVFALVWLVFVLSLGAITLLYILLRNGAAANVSSLFFLVPPCTAVVAYILFDEVLAGWSLLGMVVTIAGVALVNMKQTKVK
ncbi:DMT family transporter [Sneathiella chinensis]|uniref:Peptide ABC transporter ATP-binding protein n=1 Tax=Sneathiella chinensis TaxID=349750 RepID=A0ABQ5U0D0_9PROT|nr:DMT family transporter [Sneathiella chinensis]GLQ05309.1 peptide ABC transporter ATP-binding protein [Sneathiella chinensis]